MVGRYPFAIDTYLRSCNARKRLGRPQSLAAGPLQNGLYLFGVGAPGDDHTFVNLLDNTSRWTGWRDFGGTTAVPMTSAAYGNSLYVFSVGDGPAAGRESFKVLGSCWVVGLATVAGWRIDRPPTSRRDLRQCSVCVPGR